MNYDKQRKRLPKSLVVYNLQKSNASKHLFSYQLERVKQNTLASTFCGSDLAYRY